MILNSIERLIVNNPLRAYIQSHFETSKLLRMGGRMREGKALEVGCGPGFGIDIIFDRFGAERIDAFDLDPRMVELAKKRVGRHGDAVDLWAGDAADIKAESDTYDAVFDFFVIHHVPNWREVLSEIYRVLKPGSRFYAGEILERLITSPFTKFMLDHPQEDRFSHEIFISALEDEGFNIIAENSLWNMAGWYVADKPAR